jgi:tripartite-type tricarboxylate transporter receptor subunit TctC
MHLFIEQVCMDYILWCVRLPNLTQRKIVQAIRHYLGQVPNWLRILFWSISAFLLLNSVLPAYAQNYQNYPERPVRVLNPSSPGGGGDVIARIVMQELSKKMNQNFIVDNRPGAANIIATEMAAKAIPDGYTLLLGTTGTFVTNPLLYAKLPYSNQSFVPIVNAVNAPFILCVHPNVPATNLTELIAYAKANPDKLSFASFGKGSSNHLAGELFQILTGTKFIHVPYKGGAPGMAALLAGDITMTFDSGLTSIANIQAKKIRPIAVAAQARLSELPDVPTFTEAGLANFHAGSWYGFMAPAGTPIEIVQKLNVQINQVLRTPEITARINQLGSSIVGNTPAEFTRQIALESEVWSSVVKKAGIAPE